MNASMISEIENFMDLYCNTWPFSGSVLVSKNGETVFKKGYGFASHEYNIPNTPQTKHRICSITKQFTAMAIMMLQERGKLSTHDNARKYMPDYNELDERITIHQLLTHTSGLQYLFGAEFEKTMNQPKHKRSHMIDAFRNLPLICEPGQAWNYSNFGYYLLACIIENASGMTYDVFLTENIFKPLNMYNTGVERDKKIIEGLATGYYLNDESLIRFKYMNIDLAFGSGDIYSTVEDMQLWNLALSSEKLVSKETLDLIFTPYACSGETESEGNDYGYGWFIEEKFGRNRISHGGGGLGFITEFHRYDSEELSIIVFSNYGFTSVMRIIDIIAAFMLEEKVAFPNKPPIYELESGVFDRYIGTYKNDIEKFTVYQDEGKMYFMIDEEYVIPIFPVSPTNFHHTWIDESYTFYKDDNDDLCFCGAKKMI